MSDESTYKCEGCGEDHTLPKEVGVTSLRWVLKAITLLMSDEQRTRGLLSAIDYSSNENLKPIPNNDDEYEALLDLPVGSMMRILDVFVQTALTGVYVDPYETTKDAPIDEDAIKEFKDVLDSLPDFTKTEEGEQK